MSDKQRTLHRKNIPHKHLSWLDGIMNLEAFKITVYAKGDFVKQVWTKEQCQDLDHRFLEQEIKFNGKIDNLEKQVNQKFDQVNQRIDNFEKKVNQRIDNFEKQVNQIIDNLESRMDKLEQKVDKGFSDIMAVFKKNNML